MNEKGGENQPPFFYNFHLQIINVVVLTNHLPFLQD